MNTLLWVAALVLIGLGVLVLEVFVPSGGLLGLLSVAALIAGVATAFWSLGAVYGMLALAVVVGAVPVVLAVALRWFPETSIGRRVIPPPPEAEDVVPAADRRRRARELVGRTGVATTELVPWGLVAVDGIAVDGMSEGGPIAAGTAVDVVAAQAAAVVVRPAEPARPAAAPPTPFPADGAPPAAADAAPAEPAPLSRTLEEFDFDHLDAGDP
jgi:membrane-bound ClpP family serine protease